MKLVAPLNANQQPIENLVLQSLTDAQEAALTLAHLKAGQIFYNSDKKKARVFNGTALEDMGSGAPVSGITGITGNDFTVTVTDGVATLALKPEALFQMTLSGFNTTTDPVALESTDTLIGALNKLQSQILNIPPAGGLPDFEGAITVTPIPDSNKVNVTLNPASVENSKLSMIPTAVTGAVIDGDSIIDAVGKLQKQITSLPAVPALPVAVTKLASVTDGLEVRNEAGTELANLTVKNLTVRGEMTQVNSNEVNIGDSDILLNADITEAAQNSDGGITVKRLGANNTDRRDAKVNFNSSTNRWQAHYGPTDAAPIVKNIALVHTETIGNGTDKVFTVTHNLGATCPLVQVYDNTDFVVQVMPIIKHLDTNRTEITFAGDPAPTTGQYTITIIG